MRRNSSDTEISSFFASLFKNFKVDGAKLMSRFSFTMGTMCICSVSTGQLFSYNASNKLRPVDTNRRSPPNSSPSKNRRTSSKSLDWRTGGKLWMNICP